MDKINTEELKVKGIVSDNIESENIEQSKENDRDDTNSSDDEEEDNDIEKITKWMNQIERKLAEPKEKPKPKDFLEENRLIRESAQKKAKETIDERKRVSQQLYQKIVNDVGKRYQNIHKHMYSTQKLNFKLFQIGDMRCHLCNDNNNMSLTYNKDLLSMSVPTTLPSDTPISLVDPHLAEKKAQWYTPEGFQYPKHRTVNELRKHQMRPSETRIDDLKQPWDDPMIRRRNKLYGLETTNPHLRDMERKFQLRNRADGTFGHLNTLRFEKSFDPSSLTKRHQLPRGKLITGGKTDKNSEFFRSVHLVGDEQAMMAQMAEWQERQDWEQKVVVDDPSFRVGNFNIRDKPSQLSKYEDILKDEPQSKSLKMLHSRTSHKGKDFSHKPTPATILSKEPFIDKSKLTKMLTREFDPKSIQS